MKRLIIASILVMVLLVLSVIAVSADPQSLNVVIIGGINLNCSDYYNAANVVINGGCFPVTGPSGELGDISFTPIHPSAVSAESLSAFDTAVLNVASYSMQCNLNNLSPSQKADLVAFAGAGKKLIIYDSECQPQDYSWLPYPFTTANPGAMGAQGTLTIVEENTLSTSTLGDAYYINAPLLGTDTDAVGDMNVMTTYDPNWCLDMSGTNYLNVTGPVHTYAKYPSGTDAGLVIYNGLDMDYLHPNLSYPGTAELRKIWVQELQQPFNPSNLPCGYTVVGITLSPTGVENEVGEEHTVTAELTDLLGEPQAGIAVAFEVTSGPNAGTSGTCDPSDCNTDEYGQVSFMYLGDGGVGTDIIQACFTDQAGNYLCSQDVTKDWVITNIPVAVDIKPGSCPNPLNTTEKGVLPVAILGLPDFDVTQIDPASVTLTGVAPLRWSYTDAGIPYEPYTDKVVDVYNCLEYYPDEYGVFDGYLDLGLKFKTQEVVAALGDVSDGDVLILQLTGQLKEEFGGTTIVGEDVVWIIEK